MKSNIYKNVIDLIKIQYEGNYKNDIFINKEDISNMVLLPVDIVFDGEYINLNFTIDFYDLILKQNINFIFHPNQLQQKVITVSNCYEMFVEEFEYSANKLIMKGKLNYVNDFTEEFKFEIYKVIFN